MVCTRISIVIILYMTWCSAADNLTTLRVTCCDGVQYRLNLIPDLQFCDQFYQCHPSSNSVGKTVPELRKCPLGLDGETLFYDFQNCKCQHRNKATCYDYSNLEHLDNYYKCTSEFRQEGVDSSCEYF